MKLPPRASAVNKIQRALPLAAMAFVALVSSCVDGGSPTALDLTRTASLAVVPTFAPGPQTAAAAEGINRIRITARLTPGDSLLATFEQDVDPGASEWELTLEIPIPDEGGTVVLTIELIHRDPDSGAETVEWSGQSSPILLTPGQPTGVKEVPVGRGPTENLLVTSVTVDPDAGSVTEGDSLQLTAQVTTSGTTGSAVVYWTSLDPGIASVTGSGMVRSALPGVARVVAQAGQHADTSTITVKAIPVAVTVEPAVTSLSQPGQEVQFAGVVLDARGTPIADEEVVWTSLDPQLLANLGGGRFRSVARGEARVEARSASNSALADTARVLMDFTQADLALSKTAPVTQASVGDTVVFTVTASNVGPDAAGPFSVHDFVPAGLDFVKDGVEVGTTNTSASPLRWDVPGLAANAAASWTLTFVVTSSNEPLVSNSAQIVSATTYDPTDANNTATYQLGIATTADVSVEVEAAATAVVPGDTLSVRVRAANHGPATARDVQVTVTLPTELEQRPAQASAGTFDAPTATWTLGTMASGAEEELVLGVAVSLDASGTFAVAAAYAPSTTPDPQAANNQAEAEITVRPNTVDLTVFKRFSRITAREEDTLSWTVGVVNHGPATAVGLALLDRLDADAFQDVTVADRLRMTSQTPGATADTLVVDSLQAGDTAWIHFKGVVRPGATDRTVWNRASVARISPLLIRENLVDDADSASVEIGSNVADLALSKRVDPDLMYVDQTATYTLVLRNQGPAMARNVEVLDTFDVAQFRTVDIVRTENGMEGTVPGRLFTDSLAPGDSAFIEIRAVPDSTVIGHTVENRAWITKVEEVRDTVPRNDTATAELSVVPRETDLQVTKTVDPDKGAVGDSVTYRVTVTNVGVSRVLGVQVSEAMDTLLMHVDILQRLGLVGPVPGTLSSGAIEPGDSVSVVFRGVIKPEAEGLTVKNRAVLIGVDGASDTNGANNADSAGVAVTSARADIAVRKTADRGSVAVDDTVTYDIEVTNLGPDPVDSLLLVDYAPGWALRTPTVVSSTFARISSLGAMGGDTLVAGPLAPGDTVRLRWFGVVDTVAAADTLRNHIWMHESYGAWDTLYTNDADSTMTVVDPIADLDVVKWVDNPMPFEGDVVMFRIVVANWGPSTAYAVQLRDSGDVGAATIVDAEVSHGVLDPVGATWTLDSIPVDKADTLDLFVRVDSGTVGQTLWNRVEILERTTPVDLYLKNNVDSASVTVDQHQADLALHKFVDNDAPFEGDTVAYVVELENFGSSTAYDVQAFDSLDAGLTLLPTGHLATSGTFDPGTAIWTVDSIRPGDRFTLTLKASVDAATVGQTLLNRAGAFALSGAAEEDPLNDTASVPLTVGLKVADLDVKKLVDQVQVYEGDTVKFTITVDNFGEWPATNVQIVDSLDAGLTVDSVDVTSGSWNAGSRTWTVPTVGVGAPEQMSLWAVVDSGTVDQILWNRAQAGGLVNEADTIPGNDADSTSVTVDVHVADLALHKFVDMDAPLEGDTVTYYVELQNFGTSKAYAVEIFDSLDAGLTLIPTGYSATRGTFDPGTATWTVDSIAPGDTDTLTLEVAVDPGTGGQTLLNRAGAQALSRAVEIDPNNDTASVSVSVVAAVQTWSGADGLNPNDWHSPGNWVPEGVPGPDTDVTIPAGVTVVLSNNGEAKSLTVATGGTLDLNGFTVTVGGSVDAGNTIVGTGGVLMTGTGATVSGTVSHLVVQGDVSLAGTTHATTALEVVAGGRLSVGAQQLTVDGATTIFVGASPGAGLAMNDPAGEFIANGSVGFVANGTNSGSGLLTGGTIRLHNGLVQTQPSAGLTTEAFASTGTLVSFEGTGPQTVVMDTPGAAASRFADVNVASGAQVTFSTDAHATGAFTLNGNVVVPAGITVAVANGFTLGSAGLLGVDGAVTAASCNNLGGLISGSGTHPCSGAQQVGKVWVGATPDWSNVTNWSPTGIPSAGDDVLIRASAASQPVLSAPASVRDLTVEAGAGVEHAGFTLSASGDVVVDGALTGGSLSLDGTTAVLQGNVHDLVANVSRTVSGPLSVANHMTTNGQFNVNGQSLSVSGDLSVGSALGRLVMVTPGGVVDVGGNVTFAGAAHTGYLTEGALHVGGDFTATASSTTGFVGSSNHTVVFDGTGSQNVSFASPGTTLQRFQHVTFANTAAPVSFGSEVVAGGTVDVNAGATVDGTGQTLRVAGSLVDPGSGLSVPTVRLFDDVTELPASLATDLYIDNTVHLPNSVTLNGNLFTTRHLELDGFMLNVTGNVEVSGSDGRLVMVDVGDVLDVEGNVTYNGAHHSGYLTQGFMYVGGDFAVGASSTTGFVGSSNHTVVFDGTGAQSVSFANPGTTLQRFQHVTFANTASPVTFGSEVVAGGTVDVNAGASVDGTGQTLRVAGSLVDTGSGLSVPVVRLFDDVTELPASLATDLYIDNTVHLPNSVTLNGNLFTTRHLELDGFTLNVTGNVEVSGSQGRLVMVDAGDVLDVAGNVTYDGAHHDGYLTQGILYVAGNFAVDSTYATNAFSGSANHKVIFDGTAAQSVSFAFPGTSQAHFNDVTFDGTAVSFLSDVVAGGTMDIQSGTVDGSGKTLRVAGGLLDGLGGLSVPTVRLYGDVTALPANLTTDLFVDATVHLPNNVSLTGNLVTDHHLELSGANLSVSGNVSVSGSLARLAMVTPGDMLDVEGNVTYDGAHHDGYLTQGQLMVAGDLTVDSTYSTNAFVGTYNHRVVLDGTSPQTVLFSNPGPTGTVQRFRDLYVTNTIGVTMGSDLVVANTLDVQSGAVVDASDDVVYLGNNYSDPDNGLTAPTFRLFGDVSSLPATLTGDLYVDATVHLPNNVSLTGNLVTDHHLELAGTELTVSGNVTVTGSLGRLVMVDGADRLDVGGNVLYDGAHHDGYLTQGIMYVAGDFTVDSTYTPNAFSGSTNHTVIFDGTSLQTVTFSNPGPTGSVQRFRNVSFQNPALGVVAGSLVTANAVSVRSPLSIGAGSGVVMGSDLVASNTLDVQSGASVNASDDVVYVGGLFNDVDNGLSSPEIHFFGDLTAVPASLTTDLHIDALLHLPNNLALTGNLFSTQHLELSGHTLTVSGNVTVSGANGRVVMVNALDVLDVGGNVTYDGAHHSGYLTQGTMYLAGNLTADSTNSTTSFVSTTAHKVVFDGAGTQTVTFASPGSTAQRLNDVTIENTSFTLAGAVPVMGTFFQASDFPATYTGTKNTPLQLLGTVNVDGATFDGVPVEINSSELPAGQTFQNSTFQNQDPGITQFKVRLRGGTAAFNFLTFSTQPNAGSYYVSAESADATTLVVELVGASPIDGTAWESELTNAVINWPINLQAQQDE